VTFAWIFRKEHELCNNDYNVLEKQLTDILKRWISNVATFEKVRENSTGKRTEKKYGKIFKKSKKKHGRKVRGKSTGKKV
jgi:hypothetical protein